MKKWFLIFSAFIGITLSNASFADFTMNGELYISVGYRVYYTQVPCSLTYHRRWEEAKFKRALTGQIITITTDGGCVPR